MNILEKLIQQAKGVLNGKIQASGSHEPLEESLRSDVAVGLEKIYTYLNKLFEQLRIIDPEIRTSFEVEDIGKLQNISQQSYRLFSETTFTQTTVGVSFILLCEKLCKVTDVQDHDYDRLRNKIRHLGLDITTHSNNELEVEGHFPASMVFRSNYHKSLINLTINNVETTVLQTYKLDPENISDALLDELGKYLLRKENTFMRKVMEQEESSSHIQAVKEQLEPEEPTLTEVMDSSMVRSLYKDRQQLYLTYREKIKEVNSSDGGIIIGRSRKCDFIIPSDSASRQHARIIYRKGKFVVSDHSTNGTFIKAQGSKEVYIHGEDYPLTGTGFISLGESISVDNEHLIYYSCQ